ncbi:MAG: cupin domain-containing protein [Hyphomicrobiaceae bacterium]
MSKIDIDQKFNQVTEHWRPKIVASLNGQEVKIVKILGEFPWHHHEVEDELFLVWRGRLRIEFRSSVIELGPGEMTVVPHGVEHRPVAEEEAEIILFEPAEVRNTGNIVDETFTAPTDARI